MDRLAPSQCQDGAEIQEGSKIRALRRRLGLSARDFATFFGVRPETIYAWEEGRIRPSPDHATRLRALARIYRPTEARG
ncbi:MAG: helix-turn-helix domain-containing protein [Vulcanimicrobiaceae bacterium]